MKKINLVQKEKIEHKLEDNFLPYKESLELKKLGFDFPCFAYYVGKNEELHYIHKDLVHTTSFSLNSRVAFRCPLYQQAFQWFREKHNLDCYIFDCTGDEKQDTPSFYYVIDKGEDLGNITDTYKESELEAIKHLIKLIKEK